jgi:nitrate/nitrite transporter NarK
VTPYLVFLVLGLVNWRVAFGLFALLGVIWALVFVRWFRDDPRQHPSVNAAEAALLPEGRTVTGLANVPWSKLLRSPSVWMLCGQYFACSYAWYFYITWFPTYLLEVHKFDVKSSALLAGLPLLAGGFGCLLTGALAPLVQAHLGAALTRRLFGVIGFSGAGLSLVAATQLREPLFAVAAIAFASFCNDITIPGAWTSCMDVGGPCVGTLGGAMNMLGNLGGFLSPIVLGYVVGRTGDWNLTFYVTAAVYAGGALCWWLLDPVTPLEQQVKD